MKTKKDVIYVFRPPESAVWYIVSNELDVFFFNEDFDRYYVVKKENAGSWMLQLRELSKKETTKLALKGILLENNKINWMSALRLNKS